MRDVELNPAEPLPDYTGVVDPHGRRWHRDLAQISPARALELVQAGAQVAWDPCGCGGYCGFDWFTAEDTARMVAAGTPKVKSTKRRRGNISLWTTGDDELLVVAEDAVEWGDVLGR